MGARIDSVQLTAASQQHGILAANRARATIVCNAERIAREKIRPTKRMATNPKL